MDGWLVTVKLKILEEETGTDTNNSGGPSDRPQVREPLLVWCWKGTHTKRRRRRGEDRIDENRREKCGLVKSKVFSKKRYYIYKKKKNNRLKGRRKSSMTEAPAGFFFSPVALNHQLKKKVGDSTSRLSKSTREGAAAMLYGPRFLLLLLLLRSQPTEKHFLPHLLDSSCCSLSLSTTHTHA